MQYTLEISGMDLENHSYSKYSKYWHISGVKFTWNAPRPPRASKLNPFKTSCFSGNMFLEILSEVKK